MSQKELAKQENFKNQKEFLEKDPIWKIIFKLSFPTIMMFLAVAIYGLVDTILATQLTTDVPGYDLDTAVISMGYALSYIAILNTFTILINVGAVIHYSSLVSKNNLEEAKIFIGSTISGSIIFNTTIAAIGIVIARPIIILLSGTNSVNTNDIDAAVLYAQIASITIVINGLYDLLIRYIRTMGKPTTSAILGVSGIPVNILFDYIFMGPAGLGIEGAAIASIVGYSFTLLISLIYLFYDKRNNSEHIIITNWKNLKPNLNYVLVAMMIGVPAFVRNILMTVNSFSFSAFTNSISVSQESIGIGSTEKFLSTASSVYSQLNTLITSMMRGITQGSVVILAYNYSQKNFSRVKDGVKWMFIYMFGIIIFIASIVYPLTPQLANLFTNGDSKAYSNNSLNYAIMAMITSTFVYGINLVVFGLLNSTKQVKNSLIATFISSLLIFFIIVPVFSTQFSWEISVWSLTISNGLSVLILVPWCIHILNNLDSIYKKRENHEAASKLKYN